MKGKMGTSGNISPRVQYTIKQRFDRFREIDHPIIERLVPWVCFWSVFAWAWRVRNLFNTIPAYDDVLEVVWGIRYYYNSLFVTHTSPLFTPLIFHPWGWYTSTLAHTPVFFLAALPLYKLGGIAFAYNFLAILPFVISFAGTFRFVKLFTSRLAAICAALAFTFINARWLRIEGHLHILWATSLLPWLAWTVESANRSAGWTSRKSVWRMGFIWGMMINASLYSIFLGGLVIIFLGQKIFRVNNFIRFLTIAVLALLLASPTMALYWWGSQLSQSHHFGIAHDLQWGASLNSLFVPNAFHPLEIIRNVANVFYNGPYDESGVFNLGIMTCCLAFAGLLMMVCKRPRSWGLLWLTVGSAILSLGLLLKWDGDVVRISGVQALNDTLWRFGHILKPELFPTELPHPDFRSGIPLPSLLMTILVPFWESARVMARYAFLTMLGAVTLAAIALQKIPKLVRCLLALMWLVELLPSPTTQGVPVDIQLHPAYVWLTAQSLEAHEGILDMAYPTLLIAGDVPVAASVHGKPTVAGVGSFWPEYIVQLWEKFVLDDELLSRSHIGDLLQQYHVSYLFLHMRGDEEQGMWRMISENLAFHPVGCFEPSDETTPWPYPICVAEVIPSSTHSNLFRQTGWSGPENWGIWSEGSMSRAKWIVAAQQDYYLDVEAFPFCIPEQHQTMTIMVNGHLLTSYLWQDCEAWVGEVLIPSPIIVPGWNQLTFEYNYAISPAEVTGGKNPDARLLGVGFVKLAISE